MRRQMHSDLTAISERLRRFRDAREWEQFHTPSNLAAALAIEASELQEIFLWTRSSEDDVQVLNEKQGAVADELADVLISALNFALAAGIDPASAVWDKIERNEARYPVDRARGTASKYSDIA